MMKSLIRVAIALFLVLSFFSAPAHAALEDGTYTIDYTVMHGTDPSASIANDYWEKPATLQVENGAITVEMTLNHYAWITEFKTPRNGSFQDVTVLSEDAANDKARVQFPLTGISEMTEAKIHVVVPDIDYDHGYTVRFDFDESSLTQTASAATETNDDEPLGAAQSSEDNSNTANQQETKQENNPQTSDAAPVALLIGIAIISAIVLLINRRKQALN